MAAVPAVVAIRERDNIIQLAMYAFLAIAVMYTLFKLFGLFKDVGSTIEEKLNELEEDIHDLDPSDAPEKFKQTGKDIWTIIKGTFTGRQNTPEYNDAMARLHYGGHEWEPGSARVDKEGNIHKYGHVVKPGKTKTFAGGTYTETVVSNMVKCQYAGGEVLTKEDCLARKYGFSTYAQFNAWLAGVKAALKAAGKDPSRMSIDQIVKYGRELEKKKEEWKQNPTPVLDAQHKDTLPAYMKKQAGIEAKRWEAVARLYNKERKSKPVPSPPAKILPIRKIPLYAV